MEDSNGFAGTKTQPALNLRIVNRRIAELKPSPHHARLHPPKQIKQLAGSIEAFGFWVPALVDEEDNVIAGHARMLACEKLGWTEIPTIPVEGLSEHKRRALMIADNKLTDGDQQLLAPQRLDLLDHRARENAFSASPRIG